MILILYNVLLGFSDILLIPTNKPVKYVSISIQPRFTTEKDREAVSNIKYFNEYDDY